MRKTLFVLVVALAWGLGAGTVRAGAEREPLETIAALDVGRYMGTWYEISKFPHWFQKKCVGFTKADYALRDDGKVRVVNSCMTESGEPNVAVGVARQLGATDSPRLEVRFAPFWLAFIPAVWGDYWVIDLDDDYTLAAVGAPDREYLWVLSRSPKVDAKRYGALLDRLVAKGFDVGRLERTRQEH